MSPGGNMTYRYPTCSRETVPPPGRIVECQGCHQRLQIPLIKGGISVRVTTRTWAGSWVTLRCPNCGLSDQWPVPEVNCPCGTQVRFPVGPGSRGSGGLRLTAQPPQESRTTQLGRAAPAHHGPDAAQPVQHRAEPLPETHPRTASHQGNWPRNRYEIGDLTPYAFESFIADLLRLDGCPQVARLGGSGDDGIDVRATTGAGRSVVVQCKHVSAKITPRQVREFLGAAVSEYRDGFAIFATSSYFSRSANDFGRRHGVILVDMRLLLSWLRREWSPLMER